MIQRLVWGRTGPFWCGAILGLSASVLSGPAEARRANAFTATAVDSATVELSARTSVAQDYWCQAGSYARNQLRIPVATRIYLVREMGPSQSVPGERSVVFSLNPPEGVDTTPGNSVTVKRVGENMSVAGAESFCTDNLIDP